MRGDGGRRLINKLNCKSVQESCRLLKEEQKTTTLSPKTREAGILLVGRRQTKTADSGVSSLQPTLYSTSTYHMVRQHTLLKLSRDIFGTPTIFTCAEVAQRTIFYCFFPAFFGVLNWCKTTIFSGERAKRVCALSVMQQSRHTRCQEAQAPAIISPKKLVLSKDGTKRGCVHLQVLQDSHDLRQAIRAECQRRYGVEAPGAVVWLTER